MELLTLVDDLLQRLSEEGVTCLGYADDLAIVIKGRFARKISDRTQKALNIVNTWCRKEKLSINAQKTQIHKEKSTTGLKATGARGNRNSIRQGSKVPRSNCWNVYLKYQTLSI